MKLRQKGRKRDWERVENAAVLLVEFVQNNKHIDIEFKQESVSILKMEER